MEDRVNEATRCCIIQGEWLQSSLLSSNSLQSEREGEVEMAAKQWHNQG